MHTLDEKERFLPVVSQVGCVADRPWDLKAKTECYRGLSPPACYRFSRRNRVKQRVSTFPSAGKGTARGTEGHHPAGGRGGTPCLMRGGCQIAYHAGSETCRSLSRTMGTHWRPPWRIG